MPTTDFGQFETQLADLVAKFDQEFKPGTKSGCSEAQLRQDYLDPFWHALGWDLENNARLTQSQREVEIESRTDIEGRAKRADYLFRTDARDRFVCEAKKPRLPLGRRDAFQAKRYAFNMGLPLAVLSDFEEIKIYIVGGRPHPEHPDEGHWKTWHVEQFPLVAEEIWKLLARERIAAGSIDALLDSLPKRAPTGRGAKARQAYLIKPDRSRALDTDFLNFLDEARHGLASSILQHNPRADVLEGDRLNAATQHILDRLLFIRICEDRDIDTGTRLASLVDLWRRKFNRPGTLPPKQASFLADADAPHDLPPDSLWSAVVGHFRALDHRPPGNVPFFNGQLFKPHFSERLLVGDRWLADFIAQLSDDESPYLFNIIPVEILGSVYERFLGKVIRPAGRGVKTEEKPEVRKAGGVYYTPRYIVDYIVEQTVGKIVGGIADAAPKFAAVEKKSRAVRILDPACGSGSFLIRAFERMCEHWLAWFTVHPEDRKKSLCWVEEKTGDVHLTVDLKRQILRDNIFGVDLDPQAVEVTQLSLYLKMLEGETRQSLARERELFGAAIALLPPLDANIKCGNSLISSEFSMLDDELYTVSAFDWPVKFPEIMRAGGFDAVIGNPPYLNIDDTWGKGDVRLRAIKEQYAHIYNDKTDILFYFIGKAYQLSCNVVGYIVSRAFLEAFKANKLRGYLASSAAVAEVVDFRNYHVFEDVGITTCILLLNKRDRVDTLESYQLNLARLPEKMPLPLALKNPEVFDHHTVAKSSLSSDVWTFSAQASQDLNKRIDFAGMPLGGILHIGQGMQTGRNDVFGNRTLAEMSMWSVPKTLYYFRAANSDIQRYDIRDREEVLLFLEDVTKFADLSLGLQQYLQVNSQELKDRAAFQRGNCDWWRYTWPLHQEFYSRKRIICPFLATRNRFALVENERVLGLTDTTVLFDNKQKEALKYILGLLNSRLLTFRFKSIGKLKGGGIYEYFWNSISKLPIRRIDFSVAAEKKIHDRLVSLVDKMLTLTPKLRAEMNDAKRAVLENAVAATDRQIDALVYQLYDLSPEEIALVEAVAP